MRPSEPEQILRSATRSGPPQRRDRGMWIPRVLAGVGILFLILAGTWVHNRVSGDAADRAQAAAQLSAGDVQSLVIRAGAEGGPSGEGIRHWADELQTGNLDRADLLVRVFTGATYLMRERNDRAFAGDAYRVITGEEASPAWLDEADVYFSNGGGRLSFLEHAPDIQPVTVPEGGIQSLDVPATFPQIDGMTIGLAATEARLEADKVTVRAMLYVDGHLRSTQTVQPDSSVFRLEWDTRREQPGTYAVSVLVRSSEGRGRIIDQGLFTVPKTTRLTDGDVQKAWLLTEEKWYYVTPETDLLRFNTAAARGGLALELFDVDSNLLTTCALNGSPYSTVRHAGEPAAGYYVRARRSADTPDTMVVPYTITVSDLSVLLPDTGAVLAVRSVDEDAGTVTAWGPEKEEQVYSLSAVDLLQYTARLSSLDILLPDGSAAGLYPDFDRETPEYGLYLPERLGLSSEDPLTFRMEAQEGDAASVSVRNTRENGRTDAYRMTGSLVPDRSENTIDIQVVGFDGSSRSYTVHVLYGPHTDGYDQDTLLRFPDGYQSGLWLLHRQHPGYQIEPVDTGINWTEFLDKQDEAARSLIQSNHVPYSWVEPDSPVYDGTAWKAAARPVIAHYADPRNFLSETEVFQFEGLGFAAAVQTKDGIRAILENTFMEDDAAMYADIFYEAGEQAGISPYFLASRAIQEMGRSDPSPLSDGTLEGYEGYYNFFNVGSYPNPSVPDGQRINGALFAMYGNDPEEQEITAEEEALLLPWDTMEKSIIGGAIFIADRYVAAGQDTLYFQKFDVVPENGLYTRQYAQNIQMAWAEGRRYFDAYTALGLMETPFLFRIPFYSDMPSGRSVLP